MSSASTIEWTDATWNPVRGCSIVSPGCTNCYAMKQAHRFSGAGAAYEGLTKLTKGGPVWTGKVRCVSELLEEPLHWRKPRRIFVNSMSDLFHEDVPDQFIDEIWGTMIEAQQHQFQILTKRPKRMAEYLARYPWTTDARITTWPLPNVWLGISAEDQTRFDERWPYLSGEHFRGWPLWLSAEPLLGPLDIRAALPQKLWAGLESWQGGELKWVVVGGESGPGSRPMHPDWARSLRDQCAAAGAAFFFKQHGNWIQCETEPDMDRRNGRAVYPLDEDIQLEREGPYNVSEAHGLEFVNVGKKVAGRRLDGRTHDEYPA